LPSICSICGHPDVTEINRKLISGIQRLVVAREYKLSPPAIHRHWQDHVPHDDLYEVDKAMKSWKSILYKEQKKANPDRMVIKDCDLRLAALRNEKRVLENVARSEAPKKIEQGDPESIEFTVEGLDALIRHSLTQPHMQKNQDRLWGALYKMPGKQCELVCGQLLGLLSGIVGAHKLALNETQEYFDELPMRQC
jgi:hypothetical protein